MWSPEDDVLLSAATYYIATKVSNKATSLVNPKYDDPPQFQLAEGDSYSNSCGKIFITINHVLVFHCTFCDSKYGTLFNFLQHISANHLRGRRDSQKSEIIKSEENDTMELPVNDLEQFQEFLSLEDSSETIVDVDNTPSPDKGISIKPVQSEQSSTGQNEQTVKFRKEFGDIDSEIGHQDETSLSSIEAEDPTKERQPYKKSYKKIKTIIKCDKCDRVFTNKAVLKSHLISHSSTRNYSCTLCERTFKHKCNLNQHMIRHTNEKNYKCDLCDKHFFTHIEATIHQRRHAEDRPHVCFKCGDAFKSASNLFQHMRRRHDNIRSAKCDICEMSFFDRSQLKMHMVTHSTERPFICTHCSASFKRRYHLHQHTKVHLNAREYACNLCEKSFNLKPALKSHIKINHNILECSLINE